MGKFQVPPAEPKYSKEVEHFRGVDLLNSPSNVDPTRSPSAPNMIRDQVGKVRKRMGYQTMDTAPNGGRINGIHCLGETRLVHAGTKLYRFSQTASEHWTELAGDMADRFSQSFLFDKKLYLLDGKTYRVYDGTALKSVSETAKVPTTLISRDPQKGGGVSYQPRNLLSAGFQETFLGIAGETRYQLSAKELDATAVTAEVLTSSGEWAKKVEGTDFTVDRKAGLVTFTAAPGASPVSGRDNVKITAYKTQRDKETKAEAAEKLHHCQVCTLYGVGGAEDRVFLSGNPDKPGMDWYSAFEDPTYFPDTQYTQLSRDGSAVVGYAVIGNALAAFLSGSETARAAVIRTGLLNEKGDPVFRVTNSLAGAAPVAPQSFAVLGREPLFLTSRGVYAITAEELTGEKYAQERSYYLSNVLAEATGKEEAFTAIYRDFYVLALGGDLYLLDGQQKSYERDTPYSSFQYECYYLPKIGARVLFVEADGALWFGTADGKLKRFHREVDSPKSYDDDGEAIDAWWETGDFRGNRFYKSKTFTALAVCLAAAPLTGVKISALRRGLWREVFDAKDRARFLDWEYIDFSKFVFSADRTPHTLTGKIKLKKVDKVRFRLRNREKGEPFGLYSFAVEWKEPGGNYKR